MISSIFQHVFQQIKSTGWGQTIRFWAESFPLIVALPFLLFPQRFLQLTIVCLIFLIIGWLYSATQTGKLKSPFSGAILCLGGWSILAILVSADPELTVEKAAGLLLGLAIWRWITLFVINKASHQLLIFGYLLIGAGFVGIGFLSVDWLDKVPSLTRIINLFPQQIISFTAIGSGQGVQPNQLAGTLLWLFPVAFGLATSQFLNRQRGLAVGTGLLGCVFLGILVLSQSRGGWLGGLAAFGISLWLIAFITPSSNWYSKMRWGWPVLVGSSLILLLIVVGPTALGQVWIDPPDETAVGNLGTITFRQEVWIWALQAIHDFSFTGTGLGSFRAIVHRLYPIAIPVTYDIAHAHNVFLQVALDIGLPGLIFYLSTIGIFMWMGWQVIRLGKSVSIKMFAVGLLASQIGFHVYGLVDTISLGAKPGLLFWMQLGLMWSTWQLAETDKAL